MAKKRMQMAQKSWKIEEIFPRFVNAQMAKGVSDKTVLTYNRHFRSLGYHLDMTMTFDELTKEALDSMLVSLRKSGVSPNTISSYARVFRTFLKWCRAEGYTDLSLPNIQDKETVKGSYTDEELIALLRKPAKDCDFCEYRNWVIVNFLINSGCRAGTIRNIQNRDVSLSDKRVIYRHTKTGKLQSVPLCSQMAKILSEYMSIRGGAPEDYLFCTVYGEMMSENALSCAIKKYNHKRGVSRTSIHLFRHTFARKFLADCGGDALILQKLLGHSTLAMTKHYCAIYDTDISDNFDSFSPLAQLTKEKARIHK